MKKSCIVCGKEFDARGRARACSNECRKEHIRKRITESKIKTLRGHKLKPEVKKRAGKIRIPSHDGWMEFDKKTLKICALVKRIRRLNI